MQNKLNWIKVLCAGLLIAVLLPVASVRAEAAGYDANAAVAYAAAHWNDGVGVCDQFVKACLQAGGIDIKAGGVEPLRSALIDVGYGSAVELSQDKDSPYISWRKNSACRRYPVFLLLRAGLPEKCTYCHCRRL